MWIKTHAGYLLNMDKCRSLTVTRYGEFNSGYKVTASWDGNSTTLAVYPTREDAYAALDHLCTALDRGEKVVKMYEVQE